MNWNALHREKKKLLPMALFTAVVLLLFAGCGNEGTTTTVSVTKTAVDTVTVIVDSSEARPTAGEEQAQTAAGPYASMSAASSYVEAQQAGMMPIDPGSTWNTGATLHVIHATPQGGASYGGDYYYFFVNGEAVGYEFFTSASSESAVDSTTFSVTYNVYMPTDPHCCPSGGTTTVQFYWDGSQLLTVGSMQGAEMS